MTGQGPVDEADLNGQGVLRAGGEAERGIENQHNVGEAPEVATAADVSPVALNNKS